MASQSAVAKIETIDSLEQFKRKSHWRQAYDYIIRDYLTLGALAILLLFVVLSFSAPLISDAMGIKYSAQNLNNTYSPPSAEHILGTDHLGRDEFIRLLYGGQVSLTVAFISAMLSIVIGVAFGLIAGFYGGVLDDGLNWLVTTLSSIPFLFLLLMINSIFRPGPGGLILILGLLGWLGTMRLVRGETLALREREFIIATRAMGASNRRVMLQHIFPNLISIVVISLAIDIGALILVESGLSFLGFGIQEPVPSWGNMLTEAQSYFRRAPGLLIYPGLTITITVLCLYIIGDGIRDALDPTVTHTSKKFKQRAKKAVKTV